MVTEPWPPGVSRFPLNATRIESGKSIASCRDGSITDRGFREHSTEANAGSQHCRAHGDHRPDALTMVFAWPRSVDTDTGASPSSAALKSAAFE